MRLYATLKDISPRCKMLKKSDKKCIVMCSQLALGLGLPFVPACAVYYQGNLEISKRM
jgi:hypothetical protein